MTAKKLLQIISTILVALVVPSPFCLDPWNPLTMWAPSST